jgi:group II intron reverse transcriptase/maturase
VTNWNYRPLPVKRVRIPKPGSDKESLLGIASVKDRVLQYSLKMSLEKIFEKKFSDNSYGFRPARNQKQADSKAKELVNSGKDWIVDIDLERFFDTISHDRLIHLLVLEIKDKRILRLIGITLRSGILDQGELIESEEGAVQGSPLSPLLSNVVLHELDVELERRELSFCRFADDCNIIVSSRKAAERVLASISKHIEKKLKLKVNLQKSKAAPSAKVKFLGMTIACAMMLISKVSMNRAMEKVKELTPRRNHQSL